MSTSTSGVRMTGCIGRVNYFAWCLAVGRRDPRQALRDWNELPAKERDAWRMAAEAVLDEQSYEMGPVEHHRV